MLLTKLNLYMLLTELNLYMLLTKLNLYMQVVAALADPLDVILDLLY
jgi:hypothetical protein